LVAAMLAATNHTLFSAAPPHATRRPKRVNTDKVTANARARFLPCNCFTCDTQNCKSQLKQRPYAFKLFTVAPSLKPFSMSALPQ
jgi:hypothetical protein